MVSGAAAGADQSHPHPHEHAVLFFPHTRNLMKSLLTQHPIQQIHPTGYHCQARPTAERTLLAGPQNPAHCISMQRT